MEFCYVNNYVYIHTMKKCKKCNNSKDSDQFHKNKNSKDGLNVWCKECKIDYDKKYRKSDKVQNAQRSQKYRDRKKEYQKYLSLDPRFHLLQSAKARAKKYNLPFNIDISDIIIPKYCPILEIVLEKKEYGKGGSFQSNSPSLDKIVPELGYVKGNVVVISMKANIMKANATIDELIKFSKNIIKIIKNDRIECVSGNNSLESSDG